MNNLFETVGKDDKDFATEYFSMGNKEAKEPNNNEYGNPEGSKKQ